MTTKLRQVFTEAEKLPANEQNALAQWLMEEFNDSRKWDVAFKNSQDILENLVEEALNEHHAGNRWCMTTDC